MKLLPDTHPIVKDCRTVVERVLRQHGRADLLDNLRAVPVYIMPARKRLWGCYRTHSFADGLGRIDLCCPARERRETLLHEYAHALVQWTEQLEEDDHGYRFQWWEKELLARRVG